MAMKETVKSMRLYFFLVGIATIGQYGMILYHTGADNLGVAISGALAALFGAAFFYAATSLKSAVERAETKAIEVILYANMAVGILVGLLGLAANAERHVVGIRIIITLAIVLYLLANLKRLVKEHAAAAATVELAPPPAPPIPATQPQTDPGAREQAADGD